jgi:hypothetical protein
MATEIFFIRSLTIQNGIMGIVAAIIAGLFIRSILQRKNRHTVAVIIWALIALWFFNSPLWGFSAVTVSPNGLKLHYGFLSVLKNTSLPPATSWKIRVYMGGIRKIKKLYYLQLAHHNSMKVRGADRLRTLQAVGTAIDNLNGQPMGGMDKHPVNM